MIIIDDRPFYVPVIDLGRKGDFLDKYAERTESGDLERELIGVFFNYQLKLATSGDREEYARLWEKLTEPEEFHMITLPNERGSYTFKAYPSNVGDKLLRIYEGNNYFDNLTVNFTAKSPARRK